MPEDLQSRVLTGIVGPGAMTMTNGVFASIEGWGGSVLIDDTGAGFTKVVQEGYFDLSGYTLDDRTTFVQNVLFQAQGNYQLTGMEVDSPIWELRVVSTVPLGLDDIWDVTTGGITSYPGDSLSVKTNSDNIIAAQAIIYAADAAALFARPTQSTTWGTGDSTAAQKLYFYRAFRFPKVKNAGGNSTYFFRPSGMAFVLPITIGKEPTLEYMMRLSRSLEPVY